MFLEILPLPVAQCGELCYGDRDLHSWKHYGFVRVARRFVLNNAHTAGVLRLHNEVTVQCILCTLWDSTIVDVSTAEYFLAQVG